MAEPAPNAWVREASPAARRKGVGAPGGWTLGALAGLLVAFFALPLAALAWKAAGSSAFWPILTRPLVMQALRLSLVTTGVTLLASLAAGTPLAYLLARRRFRGRWVVEVVTELPIVLPPVVAGVGLLTAFGRKGLLGSTLNLLGVQLPFSTAAVVLAQLFVAAPYYVRSAAGGFEGVDREVEEAAAVDGASPAQVLRYVTMPLAASALGAGAVLTWARALSEFGATLMFAGNFLGRTQTMPLAIMSAMETDLDAAVALAVLLVGGAAAVLAASRLLTRAASHRGATSPGRGRPDPGVPQPSAR
ncbi:ABC transporter permease [Limnochorda pilosa]|uniref:Molybdenum ABC transporter permease n=1 Tax=Limnochorda pilosa TaxID=1555112 RepID=A0A0K2SJQ2_LIMPI|nr:ABC transporter permease [Limnochorda pilosa]BAS27341.1 molybdenum ABC transporter permease [Limnochorda pilosa]